MQIKKHHFLKIIGWISLIIVIFLFIYGIINYRILDKELTAAVQTGGLAVMFILCFILELLPFVIGPNAPIIAALAMNLNSTKIILFSLLAILHSGIIGFYLGKWFSHHTKKFIHSENIKKYHDYFDKYGTWIGAISALSLIPYVPTILGILGLSNKNFWFVVMPLRILKYAVTFAVLFWFFGLI